jgi:tetratricopeptide (TPR) repeat protein
MLDRALDIAPNDRALINRRAEAQLADGDLDGALRAIAQSPPPLGSEGYGGYITALAFQRKYEEAIAKITADLQQPPVEGTRPTAVANVYLLLGELHRLTGRSAEAQPFFSRAEAEVGRLQAAGNNGPDVRAAMLAVHASLGRREEVERAAAANIADREKDRWSGPFAEEDAARAFCVLGDYDRALSLLEPLLSKPYADAITPALLRLDPVWDPLRENPRFQKLAQQQQ